MRKPAKNKSTLYTYLQSTGVLITGSKEDIAQARKEYWKRYKAQWRNENRKQTKQFTIVLSPNEAKYIGSAAKQYSKSTTRLIRDAALAYLKKVFLVPDRIALATIQQLLTMNYTLLQDIFNENMVPFEAGRSLLERMDKLEKAVVEKLYHPKELKTDEL